MTSVREQVVDYLRRHHSAGSRELSDVFGISRQALNVHLRALISKGVLIKTGSTRNARYHFADTDRPPLADFRQDYVRKGLEEHRVYERIALGFNLIQVLRPNVASVAHYAFTEMLNNAIDHSESEKIRVTATLEQAALRFEIRDWGKGVFATIAEKLSLGDEHQGMVELIKGKTTTMPEAHSGEGIFFTSRVTDRFTLRSHKTQLAWDRGLEDVFVSSPRYLRGTVVIVEVDRNSRLEMEDVFSKYAPPEFDYQFMKTSVMIKLLRKEYVSRSEAKRLLHNLDRFRSIELNFKGVESVGQGFTDEVFRVFMLRHPEIEIRPVNASSQVLAMIRHAGHSGSAS